MADHMRSGADQLATAGVAALALLAAGCSGAPSKPNPLEGDYGAAASAQMANLTPEIKTALEAALHNCAPIAGSEEKPNQQMLHMYREQVYR